MSLGRTLSKELRLLRPESQKAVKTAGVVLLMSAMLALASPAVADKIEAPQIQVGFWGAPFGPYQTGSGGEFTLNDINGAPANSWLDLSGYVAAKTSNFGPAGITSFQTFCIERTEFISGYSTTYNAQLRELAE